MLYKKICGVAAGLLLVCGVASAQEVGKFYFGVMPTTIKFSATDKETRVLATVSDNSGEKVLAFGYVGEAFSLNAAPFRFGKQITEYVAAEFRLAFFDLGKEKAEVTVTNEGDVDTRLFLIPEGFYGSNYYVDAELDGLYGGYLRFSRSVNEKFSPYAIVGFTKMKVSGRGGNGDRWLPIDAANVGVDVSASGISYGVGGSVKLDDGWSIDFEYMQYLKELRDINGVTGIGIGVVKRF